MEIEKIRDCTLVYTRPDEAIVITCDSIGAIGNKPEDVVKVTPEHSGHETAKVALAEMLAIGATPVAISNGLTMEMTPTGERFVNGIREAMAELPEYPMALTGSSEDNMPTLQTGAGITVVGIIKKEAIRFRCTRPKDVAVLLGKPLCGESFSKELHLALRLPDFHKISQLPEGREMVPVGSKGIGYEVKKIAEDNGLTFNYVEDCPFDLKASGGPSASCILTLDPEDLPGLEERVGKMVTVLGRFA
ncbi:MAG: hypothetical protein Q4C55_09090 [Eubacterium sp.]|nr:hypothetical protein [Eubacterium sp.]